MQKKSGKFNKIEQKKLIFSYLNRGDAFSVLIINLMQVLGYLIKKITFFQQNR